MNTRANQARPHDPLRYEADMAISRMLRSAVENASSNAEALELLNAASARLHQDVAIYRSRLENNLEVVRRRGRHLRAVPVSAAATAAARGLRTDTSPRLARVEEVPGR